MHPFHKCWFHSTLIFCCATLNLNVFETGYALTLQYGPLAALLFIFFGNALLVGLALLSYAMARENNNSTGSYISSWFSKSWQKTINLVSIVWLLFLVARHFHVLQKIIGVNFSDEEPFFKSLCIIVPLAGLITFLALRPVYIIFRVAVICILFLASTFVLIYFFPLTRVTHPFPFGIGYGGISSVITIALPTLFYFPNYWHSTGTVGGVMGCLILFYCLAVPLMEISGVLLSLFSDSPTALDALLNLYPAGTYLSSIVILACLISSIYVILFYLFLVKVNTQLYLLRHPSVKTTYLITLTTLLLSLCGQMDSFNQIFFLLVAFIVSSLGVLLTSQQMRLWRIVSSSQQAAHRYQAAALLAFFAAVVEYYSNWTVSGRMTLDAFLYSIILTLLGHLYTSIKTRTAIAL